MTRRAYVSDTHLTPEDETLRTAFLATLQTLSEHCHEVFLLGDIFEAWVGDDDDDPFVLSTERALADAASRTDVFLMHGNRDFLIGEGFAGRTGVTLLDDPHRLPDGTFLAHGDTFCTNDQAYQRARVQLRSDAWQKSVLARSLTDRRALAAGLRAQSRATNANKPKAIMDVNATAVADAASRFDATTIVHGHTHRPGRHAHPWGLRYVLGAWGNCGWVLLQEDATFELVCLPTAPEQNVVDAVSDAISGFHAGPAKSQTGGPP